MSQRPASGGPFLLSIRRGIGNRFTAFCID